MKHCGTQTIETPRLLLRTFMCEDCDDMIKNWISSPKVQFEYKKSAMHITDNVQRFIRENKLPKDEICYCITKESYN